MAGMRRRRNRSSRRSDAGFGAQHPRSGDGKFTKTEAPEQQLAANFRSDANVPLMNTASDGLINLACAHCGMMTSGRTYQTARECFDQEHASCST